jgi:formylmethanofuran dehydrogenase subunit A
LIKDPWKVFLTTDHPNAGPFIYYPRIIAWLMSRKAREATLRHINSRARSKSILTSMDRELSFYEVAVMTRAGQARALGLGEKGHLGVGADADVAIYDVNPRKTDPSSDYKRVRRAFKHASYTIKGGKIVVKNDTIVNSVQGATMWLDVKTSRPMNVDDDLRTKFRQYYTVEYENYPLPDNYLRVSHPILIRSNV